jgi:cell division protein ZapA
LERIALDAEILDEKVDGKAGAAGPAGSKSSKRAVTVEIGGQEYRIRSGASEAWLRKVAACVDDAMSQIRERTDTVDSLDVALLTALNLARQVIQLRETQLETADEVVAADREADSGRVHALIEQIEAVLDDPGDGDDTPSS